MDDDVAVLLPTPTYTQRRSHRNKQYLSISKSWRSHWAHIIPFFRFAILFEDRLLLYCSFHFAYGKMKTQNPDYSCFLVFK